MAGFEEEWVVGPVNTNFYTRYYAPTTNSPPKGILVFVHGFIEHVGRYEHVFPRWAQRGFGVFAYDQRGFGRTATDAQHKSKRSSYAKTSIKDQIADLAFFVGHARKKADVPLFIEGQSMGGGIVLTFATSGNDAVALLSGVIASSPCVRLTHPPPGWQRSVGSVMASVLPNKTIAAPVEPKGLSRDPEVGALYIKDPLVKQYGTLRGVADMLDAGEQLLSRKWENWPVELPLLILHGDKDPVTSPKASRELFDKLTANDKTYKIYKDCLHELHNETEGVKEQVVDECMAWAWARLNPKTTPAEEAQQEPVPGPETAPASAPMSSELPAAANGNPENASKL